MSAYLHAASMVKVGVYIFARSIMSSDHVPEIIGWVGVVMAVITLVYGFMMYLPQKDMKRLLAWSTITQLAYIFLALSLSIFGSKKPLTAVSRTSLTTRLPRVCSSGGRCAQLQLRDPYAAASAWSVKTLSAAGCRFLCGCAGDCGCRRLTASSVNSRFSRPVSRYLNSSGSSRQSWCWC